jgi:hypothetical protein
MTSKDKSDTPTSATIEHGAPPKTPEPAVRTYDGSEIYDGQKKFDGHGADSKPIAES